MSPARCLLMCLVTLHAAAPAVAEDWSAFRGSRGNGVSTEQNVVLEWDQDTNILWKTPLAMPSNGSPIVSSGRVFIAGAGDARGMERNLYCFDRRDGRQLWVRGTQFDKEMPTHDTNPHCSSTPAANGRRVVVWHASAGLFCYDFEGRQRWARTDLGEFQHMWGYGSSPIILDDRVIQYCGPGEKIFVIAVSLETGEVLWKTDEPQQGNGERNDDNKYMGSWTTPVPVVVNGQLQVVVALPTRVVGLDPRDGALLWSCEGLAGPRGDLAYSSPMIENDLCVVIGGFNGPGIGFQLGGTGDVTESHRLWRNERNPQSIGTGIFTGGYVYRANANPDTIECLDAKTGRVVWSEPQPGVHWGSVLHVAGHLMVTNQSGNTVVFKPNPTAFAQVRTNSLGERCNATPAISEGQVFIRTHQHLYCIAEQR